MKLSNRMKFFLLKRPSLFENYNKFLDVAIKTMIYSLDHMMKHVAIIRDVDLQDPWKEARQYLSQSFDRKIKDEYTIPSYMDLIHSRLKDASISKDDFIKATNISGLNDHVCECKECVDKSPTRKAVKKATKKIVNASGKKTSTAKGRAKVRKNLVKAVQSK